MDARLSRSTYEDCKQCVAYAIPTDLKRCPVIAMRLYLSKLPNMHKNADCLFPVTLESFYNTGQWYSDKQTVPVSADRYKRPSAEQSSKDCSEMLSKTIKTAGATTSNGGSDAAISEGKSELFRKVICSKASLAPTTKTSTAEENGPSASGFTRTMGMGSLFSGCQFTNVTINMNGSNDNKNDQ